MLEELQLTRDQFIDLCILCGCDYTDKIPGIGPVRALQVRAAGPVARVWPWGRAG